MKYNICFTLGDPSGDGHANTSEYHIVATHSVEEITNAYKKTTELLGFDFVKEVGSEYEADGWIPQEYTIDGHDYIKKGYGMAHSGTCKKCKQERDSIVNVLIKELSAN